MRSRSVAALALAVVVGGLVGASGAHANHIYGATYVGTHSAGGEIRFTVSQDGSYVTSLAYTSLPAGCGLHIGSLNNSPAVGNCDSLRSRVRLLVSGQHCWVLCRVWLDT